MYGLLTFLNENNGAITALATIVIAGFTGYLAIVTKGLWRETETTSKHQRDIERAYVKMSHCQPGIKWQQSDECFTVTFKIRNFGNTPSAVTDVKAGAALLENGKPLIRPFPYKTTESNPRAFLVKNDSFTYDLNAPARGDDRESIRNGSKTLWIFGHVDYIDAFKVRHRAGYVRTYIAVVDNGENNNLFINTEFADPHYNYDRERKRGEGNDWD